MNSSPNYALYSIKPLDTEQNTGFFQRCCGSVQIDSKLEVILIVYKEYNAMQEYAGLAQAFKC